MLDPALVALAAAGGSAVVQAAGTDAWAGLRQAVAGWFGRGDRSCAEGELARLDQTAAALESGHGTDAETALNRQETIWQTRFETLLEALDETERSQAAEQLSILLAHHAQRVGSSGGEGGMAVGGNVEIHAEQGSIAAGVVHGGAHIGTPTPPAPSQG